MAREVQTHVPPKQRTVGSQVGSWLIRLLIVGALGGGLWWATEQKNEMDLSKTYTETMSALLKGYMGCKAYWYAQGPASECTQGLVSTFYGPAEHNLEFKVLDAYSHSFALRAMNQKTGRVFQIDNEGKLYLDVKGCLVRVDSMKVSTEELDTLAQKCQ
ncbi:MAG: hypothetical protein COV67_15485 [Nitrospinae bacterium CG11_big_fil_rev_8_21_14_0_20_56_8]|nr:MAG: hypothetical protein COV67_15485 [Nitrospinae bacterium CG11_big_fil_rev_8_21_14_0_20_56_8]